MAGVMAADGDEAEGTAAGIVGRGPGGSPAGGVCDPPVVGAEEEVVTLDVEVVEVVEVAALGDEVMLGGSDFGLGAVTAGAAARGWTADA